MNYNTGYEGPNRFGGCSGGGLWHMHFEETEHGKIVTKESILSGVVFWQSRRTADDTRRRLLDALLYEALQETLEPFKEHQRCVV